MKKKYFIINISLTIALLWMIHGLVCDIIGTCTYFELAKKQLLYDSTAISQFYSYAIRCLCFSIFHALLIVGLSMSLILLNPRLFRRSTWTNLSEEWAQAKSERLARKQEKAEADKQKRLEELQAEIEKLKKE